MDCEKKRAASAGTDFLPWCRFLISTNMFSEGEEEEAIGFGRRDGHRHGNSAQMARPQLGYDGACCRSMQRS